MNHDKQEDIADTSVRCLFSIAAFTDFAMIDIKRHS